MAHGLLIGCLGYDHPQWTPEPYAEDLPQSWRFCYYSNEVRSVVLPVRVLAELDDDLIQTWTDDSDAEFRFVLELSPQLLGEQPQAAVTGLRAQLAPLSGKLAAAVVFEPVSQPWAQAVQEALGPALVLCTSDAHSAGHVWFPQRDTTAPADEGVLLAFAGECEPRAMRSIFERLQQQDADCGLFFTEPDNAWRQVLQAQQMADLMGIPRGW